jgi:gluconate 5-dehydrogenase
MTQQLFRLEGKTALITGSSRGLGFEIAKGLARAGASIVLNGRDRARLEDALDRMYKEGIKAQGAAFDITDEVSIEQGLAEIKASAGGIDILVNNAGVQFREKLEEVKTEDWKRVIDINLTGAFLTAKQAVKPMMERRSGKIINICSIMSEVARETIGPYIAAKGGLKMLTRSMATEWAKYNIQVNAIGPGYFITEMTQQLADDSEWDAWLKKRTPAGRWGKPEELVGPAVFLASDASSFINGQVLYVDGGILGAL